jgi:hypothetical protein
VPPDLAPAHGGRAILLAGPGDASDIVANYLSARVDGLEVLLEQPQSRLELARRRAKRRGWPAVTGQILFVTLAMPVLRWRGRGRIATIESEAGLDPTPHSVRYRVDSVNSQATIEVLRAVRPDVVVVNGTRVIAANVLEAISCPIINIHAGITPAYRGAHGGYWALADGRPDQVGTTVHLVDRGIDTGGVLGRASFAVTDGDSIATYPYLHLAAGLPVLGEQVDRALAGETLVPLADPEAAGASRLRLHPTLVEYLRRRVGNGVR